MGRKIPRDLDDIIKSNIATLRSEGGRVVPVSHVQLWRHARDGRLITFGSPESTHVDHLQEQYKKGFPVVVENTDAA